MNKASKKGLDMVWVWQNFCHLKMWKTFYTYVDGFSIDSGLKLYPCLYSIERSSKCNFVTMVGRKYNTCTKFIKALILKENQKVEIGNQRIKEVKKLRQRLAYSSFA